MSPPAVALILLLLAALIWLACSRHEEDEEPRLKLGCDPLASKSARRNHLLMAGIGAGAAAREGSQGPPPALRQGGRAGAMRPRLKLMKRGVR